MKVVRIIGTDAFLQAAKRLQQEGKISVSQFEEMLMRSEGLPEEVKKDVLVLS